MEKAARLLATDPGGRAVGELAAEIHERHPTFALVILEKRIVFRAHEIQAIDAAERRRYERDLADRATLVKSGENTFNDATAAIQLAYPRKDWSEIVQRLSAAIAAQGAQEA